MARCIEDRIHDAGSYVNRIRSTKKREYGYRWLAYHTGFITKEPSRGDLSFLAAQTVKREITRLLDPQRAYKEAFDKGWRQARTSACPCASMNEET